MYDFIRFPSNNNVGYKGIKPHHVKPHIQKEIALRGVPAFFRRSLPSVFSVPCFKSAQIRVIRVFLSILFPGNITFSDLLLNFHRTRTAQPSSTFHPRRAFFVSGQHYTFPFSCLNRPMSNALTCCLRSATVPVAVPSVSLEVSFSLLAIGVPCAPLHSFAGILPAIRAVFVSAHVFYQNPCSFVSIRGFNSVSSCSRL
jgi:hypothetical protein